MFEPLNRWRVFVMTDFDSGFASVVESGGIQVNGGIAMNDVYVVCPSRSKASILRAPRGRRQDSEGALFDGPTLGEPEPLDFCLSLWMGFRAVDFFVYFRDADSRAQYGFASGPRIDRS